MFSAEINTGNIPYVFLIENWCLKVKYWLGFSFLRLIILTNDMDYNVRNAIEEIS